MLIDGANKDSDERTRGNSCKVEVYTPYLILNKTGLDVRVHSNTTSVLSKVQIAAQSTASEGMFFLICFLQELMN